MSFFRHTFKLISDNLNVTEEPKKAYIFGNKPLET